MRMSCAQPTSGGGTEISHTDSISARVTLLCDEQPASAFLKNSHRPQCSGNKDHGVFLRKPQLLNGGFKPLQVFPLPWQKQFCKVDLPKSGCTWGRIHLTPCLLSGHMRSMPKSRVKAKGELWKVMSPQVKDSLGFVKFTWAYRCVKREEWHLHFKQAG